MVLCKNPGYPKKRVVKTTIAMMTMIHYKIEAAKRVNGLQGYSDGSMSEKRCL